MPVISYKICKYGTAEPLGTIYAEPEATIFEGSYANAKAILDETADVIDGAVTGGVLQNFDDNYCLVIEEVYDENTQNILDKIKKAMTIAELAELKKVLYGEISSEDYWVIHDSIESRRSYLELNPSEISPTIEIRVSRSIINGVTGEIIVNGEEDAICKGSFHDMVAIISSYYADYIKVGARIVANAEFMQATVSPEELEIAQYGEDAEIVYSYSLKEVK